MIIKKKASGVMLQYDNFCKRENCTADNFPVGMAYVPWQKIDNVYECLDQALKEGTLFPELNKPYLGRRVCGK